MIVSTFDHLEALTYHPSIFLWSFLKEKVYREAPTTIEELETEIKHIGWATCKKVFHNLKKRTQTCIDVQGGHFENLV